MIPFPFYPFGIVVAVLVLGTALTLFGLAMLAMDRAMIGIRASVLPGMVRGVRAWTDEAVAEPVPHSPGAASVDGPERVGATGDPGGEGSLEEIGRAPSIAVERVRRGGG